MSLPHRPTLLALGVFALTIKATVHEWVGHGDPSMTQAVPTERFATRYVLTTPAGFPFDFIQLIRRAGSPIVLDGELVEGFRTVGEYEVADVELADGTHHAWSDAPFGAMQLGWSSGEGPECPLSTNELECFSSHAHAVGLAMER